MTHPLAKAMHSTGAVEKGGYNKHFQYAFQRKEDVFKAARHALAEHGVAFSFQVRECTVSERKTRNGSTNYALVEVMGQFTWLDAEGNEHDIRSVQWGEGEDTGDKAVNKATGQAIKYLLINTLLIPVDDDDGDSTGTVMVQEPEPEPGKLGSEEHREAYEYLTELTAGLNAAGLETMRAAKAELGVKSLKNASVEELRQLIPIAEKAAAPAPEYTEEELAPF